MARNATPAGKLNLRPLRAISTQDAPEAPDLPFFGATHLRTGLSRLPVLLSGGRLAAIVVPLFAAAFFWVTVPAFAGYLPGASNDPIVVVPPSSSSASSATTQAEGQGSSSQAEVPAAVPAAAQQAAPAAAAPAAAAPAAAPAAAAPAAAPAAVPAAAGRAPKTGANDGFLRILLVGICLALSGMALLTAPKRNPHAIIWA